jgi:hypothetical protein
MSTFGREQEAVERVLSKLKAVPLGPDPAFREAVAELRPGLEEALRVLDNLRTEDGGLSEEQRRRWGAFRDLRRAIDNMM